MLFLSNNKVVLKTWGWLGCNYVWRLHSIHHFVSNEQRSYTWFQEIDCCTNLDKYDFIRISYALKTSGKIFIDQLSCKINSRDEIMKVEAIVIFHWSRIVENEYYQFGTLQSIFLRSLNTDMKRNYFFTYLRIFTVLFHRFRIKRRSITRDD